MRTVAALYIDPRGPYPKLEGVECWDAERDARKYAGPWPVVAHPPCGPWANLRHLHSTPSERAIGIRAVEQVQKHGGVLEQPAGSLLWHSCTLPLTRHRGGDHFSVEVEQVSWGHVARKRTWLYFVGIEWALVMSTLRTGGTPTHWVSGGRRHNRKGSGGFAPPGIKICSAQQRNRTPPAFAEWLVSLARSVDLERRVG
jgi:hypothetical protein